MTATRQRKVRRGGPRTPGPGKKLGTPKKASGLVPLNLRVYPRHVAALDRLAAELGRGQSKTMRGILEEVHLAQVDRENNRVSGELYDLLLFCLRASEQ